MKRFAASIILACSVCLIHAAPSDSIAAGGYIVGDWAVEAAVNVSRILPTNSFLKNTRGNDVIMAPDLRTSFSFGNKSAYGRRFHNVRQGIGVSLNNILPHSSLNRPVNVYLFQNVKIAGSKRIWLEGEWNFGVSAGWSKYNPASEIVNNAIGSRVNAMLGVGLAAIYRINDRWRLKATVDAIHYSNGNTHLPNAGVNTVGLSIGAQYYFDPEVSKTYDTEFSSEKFKRGFSYDLTLYGAARRRIAVDGLDDYVALKGSFGIAGINFAGMYDINRYFRAGLSLDMQYDESANLGKHRVVDSYGENIKFYRQPFIDCFAAGLSVRAELTLPVFSINVGLGRNIIANGPDTRIFYQTLALKAYVWRNSFIQIGYQLCDFHLPNNLMLGIGYTFGRK